MNESNASSHHVKMYFSQIEKGLGTGLAADVDDVVSVGEAVELGGRALGVRSHLLKVQPVTNVQDGIEAGALGDLVDAIAGRAPDGVLDAFAKGGWMSSRGLVMGLSTCAQDLRNRVLVVEHDVREVAVNTVVDVNHVGLAIQSGILNGSAGDDVAGNCERSSDVVSSRFGNDLDVAVDREELVEGASEDGGHSLEGVAGEPASDIESAHVEAEFITLLKHQMGIANGLPEGEGVSSTRSDVEADSNNIQAELLREVEKAGSGVHGSAEFHAESAETVGVVGHDAEEELGSGVELGDLVELIGIVKGHLLDAHGLDISDVGVGLAGLGIDDALGAETELQDLLDFGLGGTIEASSKCCEKLDNLDIRVALDS